MSVSRDKFITETVNIYSIFEPLFSIKIVKVVEISPRRKQDTCLCCIPGDTVGKSPNTHGIAIVIIYY